MKAFALLALIQIAFNMILPLSYYSPIDSLNSKTVCQVTSQMTGARCPLNLYKALSSPVYVLNPSTYAQFSYYLFFGINPNNLTSKLSISADLLCPIYTYPGLPKNLTYSGNNYDITKYGDLRLCQERDSFGLVTRQCINVLDRYCAVAGATTSKNFPGKTCCPH